MATLTEKTLGQAQINNAANTTVYTVPASTTGIIKTIFITNTTAVAATIEMWIVPNAGSADDTNKLFHTYTIPARDFMQIITFMPMETAGDTLQAKASAATTLTVNLFGAEVV